MLNKKKSSSEIEIPLLETSQRKSSSPESKDSPFYSLVSKNVTYDYFNREYNIFYVGAFIDIFKFLFNYKGDLAKLDVDDLPPPYDTYDFESKLVQFHEKWQEEMKTTEPSVIRCVFRVFKKELIVPGIILFCSLNGRLLIILIMGSIMQSISDRVQGKEIDLNQVIAYTFLFAFLEVTIKWSFISVNYFVAALGNRIKQTIMAYLYTKIQSTALSSIQEMNIGKVVNLLGNNLVEIEQNMVFFWWTIFAPWTISLTSYVVWQYFGAYSLVSVVGLFLTMLYSQMNSKKTVGPRQTLSGVTDERIKLTNEFIDCIRMIKLYAWEKPLKQAILKLREKEAFCYNDVYIIEFLGRIVSETSVYFCIFIMCTIYTLCGGVMESAKLYTSIMVLGFCKTWGIGCFQQGTVFIANARVLAQRVKSLLVIPDINGFKDIGLPQTNNTGKVEDIVLNNFSAYWKKDAKEPFLKNISCRIPAGKVTAVIGKVGSGKTTLLHSFLKEIPKTTGSMKFKGSFAYVEQEPIVFSGTVKWNITFGLEFDSQLYQQVIQCCNLITDLRGFPDGDLTIVGEKGINLSGGQKARISLARAIYSRSDIYLFDDPLSAVDSKVALQLFQNAIRGKLLMDKTVILVTHHLHYAKEADHILVLDEGKLLAEGPFSEVEKADINLLNIFNKENKNENDEEETSSPELRKRTSKKASIYENSKTKEKAKAKETSSDVTFESYKNYLKANQQTNRFYWLMALYAVNQFTLFGFVRFLGYWAAEQNSFYSLLPEQRDGLEFDNGKFIFWGLVLTVLLALGKYYKIYYSMWFLLETNTKIHNMMIEKLARAVVSYFDNTPVGVILNKFSGDLSNSDKENFKIFLEVVEGFVYIMLFIVTFSVMNPIILPGCLLSIYFVIKARKFFVKPLKQVRRLDMAAKSPLYSDISMTLHGLSIVRSFRQGSNFIKNFFMLMARSARVFQFQQRSFRFFVLNVDMSIYVLTIGSIFGYMYAAFNLGMAAESFGSAITFILEIIQLAGSMLRQSVNMDVSMQNAQRMLDMNDLPQEPPEEIPSRDLQVKKTFQTRWPERGEIIFQNIYMKYAEDLPYAVNGISFKIKAGTKVGCIGRTGAGKSSIIQALFRMVDIERHSDSYIKIDGVNIHEIGLDLLRSNLSIIPQMPVIFTGTIRRNLDPFSEFSDDDLWQVIKEVNLETYINSLPKKIMTDITLSNSIFSAGQKQQVCLARAILRRSKIIVLDEATANVDLETDLYIQDKVMEIFKDSTILTVAHRLTSIANYDKILVLDKGRVVEYDDPFKLLVIDVNDSSITSGSLFAEMVISSGQNISRKIFEIAKKTYFSKIEGEI